MPRKVDDVQRVTAPVSAHGGQMETVVTLKRGQSSDFFTSGVRESSALEKSRAE